MPDDWYLIALLNLSVQGFSFVDMFHDKAKRAHQGNVLDDWLMVMKGKKHNLPVGRVWNSQDNQVRGLDTASSVF